MIDLQLIIWYYLFDLFLQKYRRSVDSGKSYCGELYGPSEMEDIRTTTHKIGEFVMVSLQSFHDPCRNLRMVRKFFVPGTGTWKVEQHILWYNLNDLFGTEI